MIRVVLDTNVIVSALLQPANPPARLLTLALTGAIQLCVSGSIFAEYEEVIHRPRFRFAEDISDAVLGTIRLKAAWVRPAEAIRACSDPDDDAFLECAHAARADYLVTGNLKHFPTSFSGTQIVSPARFLDILGQR